MLKQFIHPLELSALNGENGFTLNGIVADGGSGASVASAGDINGDGMDDVIIGARHVSPDKQAEFRRRYVIFGTRIGWNATLDLSTLNGMNGFIIPGLSVVESMGHRGRGVASAGDINGDGVDDVVIGEPGASPGGRSNAGESYVIFGKRTGWNATLDLSALNGTNGFRIQGIAQSSHSGNSVASGGDINGDGVADVIIGSYQPFYSGRRSHIDASYVIFGKRTEWDAVFKLSDLNGINGFRIQGTPGDYSGSSVAGAGDFNGDGVDDVIIGASGASPGECLDDVIGPFGFLPFGCLYGAGASYVVFGKRTGWDAIIALSSLNGKNGLSINGIASDGRSGTSVASAGDINGDGIADLIIEAAGLNSSGLNYVVFGSRSGWGATLELSDLNGANGFNIKHVASLGNNGASVASAGDFNNDGFGDLIIGAPRASSAGSLFAGSSYVVFGKRTRWGSTLEPSDLNGINGFRINGIVAGDCSGHTVANAGDLNGDNVTDVIIGAPCAGPGGRAFAGASYVVFGGAATLLPPSPNPTPYPSPAVYPTSLTPGSTETHSSAPAIIGGVIAGLVAMLGIGALAYRCCFKKRIPKKDTVEDPESAPLQSISPQEPLSSPTTPISSGPLACLVADSPEENKSYSANPEDPQKLGSSINPLEPLMLFNKTSFEDAPKPMLRERERVPQDSPVPLGRVLTWSKDREAVNPPSPQGVLASSDTGVSRCQSPATEESYEGNLGSKSLCS